MSSQSAPFELISTNGWLRTKGLMGVRGTAYNLKVLATDQIAPQKTTVLQVTVIVSGVNEHSPKFSLSKFDLRVREDAEVGSSMASLTATDPDAGLNGQLQYRILEHNMTILKINTSTGVLSVGQSLRGMANRKFKFTIQASDQGYPSRIGIARVSVTVNDVNDHPPRFTRQLYNFYIPEGSLGGTSVGAVRATDADRMSPHNLIEYRIVAASDFTPHQFNIDKKSGMIRLVEHGEVDFEQQRTVELQVMALNPRNDVGEADNVQLNSSCKVRVHVDSRNEFAPKCARSQQDVMVSESVPTDSYVGQVRALDRDSGKHGRVRWALDQPSYTKGFRIDADTGWYRW